MTVHMTFTDIEEYNMRSIANLGCNMYSQITVAHVTLPKAVLNTVEIIAVYIEDRTVQGRTPKGFTVYLCNVINSLL